MPVHCQGSGKKWYVVEADGKRATGKDGQLVHKKPHPSKSACVRQATAINHSLKKKEGKK